ncbi:MAG: hypothetical protein ACI8WB_002287 [Phenylobacterium sp.]|jgi:hypothetical protein
MPLGALFVTVQRTHLSHHNGVIFALKQLHMTYCAPIFRATLFIKLRPCSEAKSKHAE